ncbi:hypothetical protein BV898_16236 [Hypsibius exemplaris]|uniref:Uncharacterized protein n=1 Tax=Hypsibius exemplaris TaxID=2072580 RepID=A0A9X6RKY4_HYPEX|nr:hypothetical protein BV898_16236 [Hypsibius exemplaris]
MPTSAGRSGDEHNGSLISWLGFVSRDHLKICSKETTCCTKDMEEKLNVLASQDYAGSSTSISTVSSPSSSQEPPNSTITSRS